MSSSSTTVGGATTSSFVVTLVIDIIVGGLLFIMFCYFRRMKLFRWIYQSRLDPTRRKSSSVPSPSHCPNTLFGWISHVYTIDSESLLRTSGMDNTMYVMWFASMFKLMCWLFIPSVAILLPINITGENHLNGFDSLSMSNISENSVRLWAHIIIFYYVVIVTCYWLYRSYRLWLNLRIDYLKQAMFKGGAMSIVFTDLPKSYRTDQSFYKFAYDIFGDHLHSTYMPRDLHKLHRAIMERADLINHLEQSISKQQKLYQKSVKYTHNDQHHNTSSSTLKSVTHDDIKANTVPQPPQLNNGDVTIKQSHVDTNNTGGMPPLLQYKWYGIRHGWKKIDIIQHYTDRLNTLNELITNEQIAANSKPVQAVGIVTLRSALMTSMASRTPGSVDPFSLHIQPAPEPEDIDWNNIKIDDEYKQIRQYIVTACVLTGVIFYCVPVTFFTGLTSISGLRKILPNVAAAAQSNVILNGLLTGFLPSLGYIIFMALLPLVLNIASRAEGM